MILPFFDHLYMDIFYSKRGQKWTWLDHLPTSSCPRSYWMTPSSITVTNISGLVRFCLIFSSLHNEWSIYHKQACNKYKGSHKNWRINLILTLKDQLYFNWRISLIFCSSIILQNMRLILQNKIDWFWWDTLYIGYIKSCHNTEWDHY